MKRQYVKSFTQFLNENKRLITEEISDLELPEYKNRCTGIFRKFLENYEISHFEAVQDLVTSLSEIQIEVKDYVTNSADIDEDYIDGTESLWFKFYQGDTTVTTIDDLSKYLDSSQVPQKTVDYMIESIKMAVENDSLEVYFS